MKTFSRLVSLKDFREEKAGRAMLAQKRRFEEATAARDHAAKRLQAFRDFAAAEELRMYRELCSRPVLLRHIDDVRNQMLLLKSRERDHEDELDAAEADCALQERQLESDREAHREALRKRDKYHEIADVCAQEERAVMERAEDSELEEAAGLIRVVGWAPAGAST